MAAGTAYGLRSVAVPGTGAEASAPSSTIRLPHVDMDDARGQSAGLGVVDLGVADQDDQIAGVHEVGGCAVDADDTGAALALDDVRLQPGTVVDVDDVHELPGQQIGRFHQLGIDSDRADVVQIGLGHGGPVDLRLEHRTHHRGTPESRLPACVYAGQGQFPYLTTSRMFGQLSPSF